nr:hypothetical protein CFP56_53738 [Quercus suber]
MLRNVYQIDSGLADRVGTSRDGPEQFHSDVPYYKHAPLPNAVISNETTCCSLTQQTEHNDADRDPHRKLTDMLRIQGDKLRDMASLIDKDRKRACWFSGHKNDNDTCR